MPKKLCVALIGFAGLTLVACGGGGGGTDGPDGTDAPAPVTAALSSVADCEELHAAVRADARAKIHVQADELRANGWAYSGGGRPTPVATFGGIPTALPSPAAAPPRDATDTNTQVPGVDEADVVEIDRGRIYLLRNRATPLDGGFALDSEMLVLPAVPPEATALGERIAIEGSPLGMFVTDGRGLVVSAVYDDGVLGGDSPCDTIGPPFPLWAGVGDPGIGLPGFRPCSSIFTKVTVLDLATAPSRVMRELFVEGSYVSARRHGTRARIVVQRGWGAPPGILDPWSAIWSPTAPTDELEFRARLDAWEAEAIAVIDASPLEDWLPSIRERVGGALIERPLDCTDTHVAPAGHADQGTTLIVGLDLGADDAPLDETTLLGVASHVYANADTLVLAYPDWQAEAFGDATTRTALHVFALPADSLETVYRGSGFVPGSLLSQFAIDVQSDVVRVATGYARTLDDQNVTRVLTARVVDGEVVTIGATGDIAPGEVLRSVRFIGDRAYVVTFFQIDPLFVVDLADPTRPTVVGEVEIPGFSTYLHPLDATHLLTIGYGDGLSNLALKVFDVGNAAAPRLVDDYTLPPEVSSPADANHLAFVFDTRLGLLALPVTSYGEHPRAMLQLLAVEPTVGIELRGTVDHGPKPPCDPPFEQEICYVYEGMERGVFIGDAVYSISNLQLRAHALDDLATPLAIVSLP